jgi:dTDP-4-dehydrorhamnose 3,5-epimerase-like enzyme
MNIRTIKDQRGNFNFYDVKNWDQVNVVTNPAKWTFRGMHYQTSPAQTKMVKVVQGSVVDFLYDLENKEVKIYTLTPESEPLFVPDFYAHGYITLEPNTIFTYMVKGKWNPESEHSIGWRTIPEIRSEMEEILDGNRLIISDKDDLPNKPFVPKGKPHPEHDTWFDKNDRKQRG